MSVQHIPGPSGPIPFERDVLGYPSVRAKDFFEGSYALGYLHARDRLVQATLTDVAARGALMSVLGDVPLARLIDRSVRAIGLTQDLEARAQQCDAETARLLGAYVSGFNHAARARGTPLLLRLLGLQPLVCSVASMLALFRFIGYFGLTSQQLSAELILAELAGRGAPRRLFERLLGSKASGLELEPLRGLSIPPELSFFEAALTGTQAPGAPPAAAPSPLAGVLPRSGGVAGSNAFAVAGSRSASGGALLMGEFHMEVGRFPPIAYAAHLAFESGDFLSGITIPGLSWFAAGRTARVGWSYTFAHADNVDVVVEHVKGGQYLVGDEYRPLRRREEHVKVRGRKPETWVFHDHEYGTVLGDVEAEADRAAVRVSGLAQSYRAFASGRRQLECDSVSDLLELQREVRSLSLEAILVDHHGDIASVVTGQIDQRPAFWTGAYPVPRARLSDLDPPPVPEAQRPVCLRPESGVLVSANQGGHGPHRDSWCSNPEPHYRFDRINELLAGRDKHMLESMIAASYDTVDLGARRLVPVWAPLLPDPALARSLAEWSSTQQNPELSGLFHRLHEEVCLALLAEDIGQDLADRFREASSVVLFQYWLDEVLALKVPELLDREQLRALLAVATERAKKLPHALPVRMRFRHLVTQGKTPTWLGFDSARVTLPGTTNTPFQCRPIPLAGEHMVYAPVFHVLFDMSQRDVWYNLPGGASESRFGPGYGKGLPEWLRGELLPLGQPGSASRKRAGEAMTR